MTTNYDVIGIGNALLDIIAEIPEQLLHAIAIPKGSMALVDDQRADQIYKAIPPGITVSGGSVGNTMAGLAMLGARCAFIGRVADDEFAQLYAHDLQSIGVEFLQSAQKQQAEDTTGHCLIMVTPDKERTMATCLGISSLLAPSHLPQHEIAQSRILYLEGYLFDNPASKEAYEMAAQIAKSHDRKIAFSLSDSFCVERHHHDMVQFITKHVDILFGNESEITALSNTKNVKLATDHALEMAPLVCCTYGANGAGIYTDLDQVELPAMQPTQLTDLTGAGDQFAAGFLFGHVSGWSNEDACRLGIALSTNVIAKFGGRPDLAYTKSLIQGVN